MPKRRVACVTSPLRTMGLDLSITATGICVWDGNKVIYAEEVGSPAHSGTRMERVGLVALGLTEAIEAVRPDYAMVESYAWSRGGKGQIVQLAELGGVIRFLLWSQEVPFNDRLTPQQLKLFATGFGDADKKLMLSIARRKYWAECPTHNVADALHLARYAHEHYQELVHETTGGTLAVTDSMHRTARHSPTGNKHRSSKISK